MHSKRLLKECEFANEMKGNVLPTKKDVIGHYYCVRNRLMSTDPAYLQKRPPFSVCKEEVINSIVNLWKKSSLPIINQKSIYNKMKKLISDYAKSKTKKRLYKLKIDAMFDVCTCQCEYQCTHLSSSVQY